jgi:transglutaminase-like putative cysteine protease
MEELLGRLLRRATPPGGWMPFLLVLAALLSPAAALPRAGSGAAVPALFVLTLLAAIAGVLLARSRLSTGRAAILGTLLGLGLILVLVGRLLPPPALLRTEISYGLDWLRLWRRGELAWPLPFASVAGFLWQRLYELGLRLWLWARAAASGAPAQDTIFLILLTAISSWVFALLATWGIYRRRSALPSLLPPGLIVTMAAFLSGGLAVLSLIAYLFCVLWLIAICNLWTQTTHWDRAGLDYPGSMGVELLIAFWPWISILLLLAAAFPVIRLQPVSDASWRLAEGPWSAVERLSERLFGSMPGGFEAEADARAGGALPRSHLLGAGPEVTDRIVLYVRTSGPAPSSSDESPSEGSQPAGPRRYWRGETYDTYTGAGWENSSLTHRTLPPNTPLDPTSPALNPVGPPGSYGPELVQSFDLVGQTGSSLYTANEPLRIDQTVQTWWRAPGDLVQITGDTKRYSAVSRPPQPTLAQLRAAPTTLPRDLAQRYLALPDTVPQRVLDLTMQVVGAADTEADRALAIEGFLRSYPYTLDLPQPPTDRDVVDYFLFDLQRGYCDYFASAMVVMARAAGLPARFATGYAQGTYDHDRKRWVVREKDAHSWVEVYFESIGWVEFEPTPGQPGLIRPAGGSVAEPSLTEPARHSQPGLASWPLLAAGGALILLIAVLVTIRLWQSQRQRHATAADLVRDRHLQLLRWGRRLREPLHDGQTAQEYGAVLSDALLARGGASRWSSVRQASTKASPEITELSEAFTRAQYRREATTEREGWHVRGLWTRLRRRLWLLWLTRR